MIRCGCYGHTGELGENGPSKPLRSEPSHYAISVPESVCPLTRKRGSVVFGFCERREGLHQFPERVTDSVCSAAARTGEEGYEK